MNDKPILCWWMTDPKPGNLGDVLTPFILKKLGYNIKLVPPDRKKLICIGSLAKFINKGDVVWGTGIMRDSDPIEKDATYLAVRGPLTGAKVGCSVYGDPGLLCSNLWPYEGDKTTKIGVVPHYVDYNVDTGELPKINVINANPITVAHQIAACDKIISTSLHGIIVAHSYGVPAAWWKPTDKLRGDGSKFKDYAKSVGVTLTPCKDIKDVVYTLPDKEVIAQIQNNLIDVLHSHMEKFKVISFYSEPKKDSTYYTDCYKKFKADCDKFSVDYDIKKLEGHGNYYKNTRMKPQFILDAINKFKMPVMWMDIDTKLKSKPVIPRGDFDICCVRHSIKNQPYLFYAHLLYFRYNDEVVSFLKDWVKKCKECKNEKAGDHSLLFKVLKNHSNLKIKYIEKPFCGFGLSPYQK